MSHFWSVIVYRIICIALFLLCFVSAPNGFRTVCSESGTFHRESMGYTSWISRVGKLWKVLEEYNYIPSVESCGQLYEGSVRWYSQACVTGESMQNTQRFEVNQGVCQGCVLSPVLFSIFMDRGNGRRECRCWIPMRRTYTLSWYDVAIETDNPKEVNLQQNVKRT